MSDNFDALFDELLTQERQRRLNERSIDNTKIILRQIRRFASTFPSETKIDTVLKEYMAKERRVASKAEIRSLQGWPLHKARVARYLLDLYTNGQVCWYVPRKPTIILNENYETLLKQIEATLRDRYATIGSIIPAGRMFLYWLQKKGIKDISSLTSIKIGEYIDCKICRSGNPSRGNFVKLKVIIKALIELGRISPDCLQAFLVPIKCRNKLIRPVRAEVIRDVLDHIDRNTAKGKRDYAIILIAVVTGLRAVDIRKLKFSSIDWGTGEIHIVQSKTGKLLTLPLSQDIAESIRDYVDNGRPNCENRDTIFITDKSPYAPMGISSIRNMYSKRVADLGYSGEDRWFHGIRRLRGVSLVNSGTPLPIIMQTLGHVNPLSTDKYLSFDSKNLKICALPLRNILSRKGDK